MALDVANLGFQVDSSQLRSARTDLVSFGDAAQKAVQPVANVGKAVGNTGQAAAGATAGMSRFANEARNISYQVQDMAVQIGMGTSVMTTMGQQLPQLLGGFGLWGAAIGAVVAVGAALAPVLLTLGAEGQKLSDVMRDLAGASAAYADAAEQTSTSLIDLAAEFGRGAVPAREMYGILRDIALLEFQQKMTATATAVQSAFQGMDQWLNLSRASLDAFNAGLENEAAAMYRQAIAGLNGELGLTVVQAQAVQSALDQINNAATPLEQSQGFRQLATTLLAAADNGAKIPPELIEAARASAQAGMEGLRLANALDEAGSSAGAATGQTYAWADAMASVVAQVNAVAAALAAIGGGMISRAAMFVERNALAAGKTVAQARVEVEKFKVANEWDAQIMGARAKGGIFGAVASKAMEAAKAVDLANVEMAAQNAIITQNAAAAERAAAKTGGGKKGRKSGGAAKLSDEAKAAQEATEALARLVQEHSVLQATLGMTETQERAYRAAMELGAGATDAQRLQVMQLVPEMARLEEQQQVIRDRAEAMQQGFREMFTGIISGAKSARDAIADMASKLAEMMANRAFDSLLAGGLGRFFGGDPLTAALSRIPGLATGGHINRGGWAMVGERGPELVHLPSRATVYDNRQTRGAMAGGAMTYAPVFNIGGNVTAEDLAAVRQESLANYHQMQRTMPAQVQRVNRDPLRR